MIWPCDICGYGPGMRLATVSMDVIADRCRLLRALAGKGKEGGVRSVWGFSALGGAKKTPEDKQTVVREGNRVQWHWSQRSAVYHDKGLRVYRPVCPRGWWVSPSC